MPKARGNAEDFVIREYREGDEAQILPLFRMVLMEPEQYNDDYWRWMYRQNPAKSTKIWLAFDGKKLVGHYTEVSRMMAISGQRRMGAIVMNLAIHPDYQGKGIFPKLAARVVEEAGKERIVFTLPNKRSYPIFAQKLGYVAVCSLCELYKPMDIEGIVKRYFKGKYLAKALSYLSSLFLKIVFRSRDFALPAGVTITKVSTFDERIDELWKRASKNYNIMTVRDRDFLNWRYADRPTNSDYTIFVAERGHEMLGYIILKLVKRGNVILGDVMDILTLPGDDNIAGCLISTSAQRYLKNGVEALHCQTLKNNPCYQSFRQNGFIPLRGSGLKLLAQATSPEISQDFISDPRNWFLTRGDETTK